ncbi:uncharacterized protein BDV17DRAFT_209852 [Aspergillus undulatus]|uniref:uncharacterized protein n=1 Tax=Aspergillus undulatus TaxID=1810928 RepID=UPI003CCD490C
MAFGDLEVLGDKYNVLIFSSLAALKKTSIRELRECDIILVSWAIFSIPSYSQHLQKCTGVSLAPEKAGRNTDEWFQGAYDVMKRHVRVLVEEDPRAFLNAVRQRRAGNENAQEYHRYAPSKRLRGKKYAMANRNNVENVSVPYAEISSADENSESSDEEDPDTLRAKVAGLLQLVSAI